MSNAENRRIDLASLVAENRESVQDALSILYVIPLLASKQQYEFVHHKYADMISSDKTGSSNLLSYQSIDNKDNLLSSAPQFIQKIYTFSMFCLLIRKKIKSSTTMHLFLFSSVSFFLQIIPLLIIGKFYRKSVVVEFFDFKNFYFPEEVGAISRYFLEFADCVIVPSDRQSRSLRQKKIQAVNLKEQIEFQRTPRIIEEVQPLIMAPAYFENVFNLKCLLKAFSLVKQKYPRAELVIAGCGSQIESMEELVSSNSVTGVSIQSSDRVKQLYNEADIYVHCYHIEYFAQEILQAMACGIPVLSSPLGMVNSLIQKENILMYQFNDFSTLADNFLMLIEDNSLVKKLSVNGVQFTSKLSKSTSKNSLDLFYKNLS